MTTIKGIIYRIIDNTNNNIYYGSTLRKLRERKAEHKYQYKQYCKGLRGFTTVYDILKNNNWNIELIEECEDIKKRERYYIENNDCVNKRIEGRTLNEYYIQVLKPQRQETYFCETCQKKVKKSLQKTHEQTKLHLGVSRKKRPLILNKNDKILCECGLYYTRNHKTRHQKSKKHFLFLK